jgi:putative endonuclease
MKRFTSSRQRLGLLAEDLSCRYLAKRGFHILERNYTKRCGEIDIVAAKNEVIHFIEVKCVSREIKTLRPEDQMSHSKQSRLARTIEEYLAEHDVGLWQVDLVCLIVDGRHRMARVWMIPGLILAEN